MTNSVRAAAALALAAGLLSTPVHAASVCLENNQLTFNPPLGTGNAAGLVTINYQGTCADLPGLNSGHYAGSVTVPYFGSCALALIAEGGQSFIALGTVYAFVRGQVQVKVEAMQPNNVCPVASAHGTGIVTSVP